jgi:hypothetical protein
VVMTMTMFAAWRLFERSKGGDYETWKQIE